MLFKILLVFFAVMSIIDFILYGSDKKKAVRHERRIRERTLLLFGVFGGAPGGILGMLAFRHKTKHWYFWVVNIAALFILSAVLGFAIYVTF